MNVYLTSLGCRLNEAELQTWANDFNQLGISVTSDELIAALIVINTCAVTGEAARKSRQTIRRYHRKNPTAKIIITGCYASLEKQEANNILGVDLVVSNAEKHLLASKAKELLDWKDMPFSAIEPEATALFARNKERAFIKVQDGCRYRCTYCIVTIARGDEVSRTIDDIVEEIKQLTVNGIQEIVLTGVHVGGYGSDLGLSLYELVEEILRQTEIPRIRFASVEPWDLPEHFFELFTNKRLMPHMHLPIQSGSNRILKKMSRRCKSESFLKLVENAKKVIPDFNFTTDIIVGFPGETDEDFLLSQEMIKQAHFGHVHIFSYSKREGTKASNLPNQIDASIKKIRSEILHKEAENEKSQQLKKMIGQTCEVLWEGEGRLQRNGKYRHHGYTPNYHKVFIDNAKHLQLKNRVFKCEVKDLVENLLLEVVALESLSDYQQVNELNIKNIT